MFPSSTEDGSIEARKPHWQFWGRDRRFRPQLRTAPLKRGHSHASRDAPDRFPSSTEDGSIEALQSDAVQAAGAKFPSSTEDGSIEAGRDPGRQSTPVLFPSSTEDGSIEAAFSRLSYTP